MCAVSSQRFARVEAAASTSDLEASLTDLVSALGVEYFSYVFSLPHVLAEQQSRSPMLLTNYPDEWARRYRAGDYHNCDPVVTSGSRARRPFFWGGQDYLEPLTGRSRRMVAEGRGFGIISGLTVPVHGPLGEWGLFSVASGRPFGDLHRDLNGRRTVLELLGARVHAAVVERIIAAPAPVEETLSDSERVCLHWTLRGKTAWEIARIIGRSKSTVDLYAQTSARKLGASNKVHAAFKALQAGLL